jgi:Ca2+-transporting ATPase
MNLTTLIFAFLCSLVKGFPAFSVVQLLWINMIMDLLAALSLAAERPQLSVIKNPAIKRDEPMITESMWK